MQKFAYLQKSAAHDKLTIKNVFIFDEVGDTKERTKKNWIKIIFNTNNKRNLKKNIIWMGFH